MSGHYFSKTGGLSPDGKSIINTKGTNAPVVRRRCAESDGSGYLTFPNGAISGVVGSDWCLAFCINPTTLGASQMILGSFDTTGTTKRFYISINNGTLVFRFGTGETESISTAGFFSTGTNYLIMICYSNTTGVITTKIKNLDTGTVTDGADYTPVGLTELNDNALGVFSNSNGAATHFLGKLWNLRIWFSQQTFENMADLKYSTGTNLHAELERSIYDISGNGYHGTIKGTVDLAATYENTSGVYSYNLNNGFDRYTD
ncbi:MAG TPA: hypothetical protein PLB16_06790, partial [bacterium]|nr:hypothetical protein [bacterium]